MSPAIPMPTPAPTHAPVTATAKPKTPPVPPTYTPTHDGVPPVCDLGAAIAVVRAALRTREAVLCRFPSGVESGDVLLVTEKHGTILLPVEDAA